MSRQRKNHSHGDSRRYYDWLDRAGEDIIAAGVLLHNDNCYNSAAFHCQQAIEKALKAYILLKSDMLVDGHNLPWLCKRAMRYNEIFTGWMEQCTELTHCYIETRYPSDLPLELDFARVTHHYHTARDMYLFICEQVDSALDQNRAHPAQKSK